MKVVFDEWLKSLIVPVLEREQTWDIEYVEKRVNEKRAVLFRNKTSLLIVEIINYSSNRVLNIWIGAGELEGMKELLIEVEMYAKKNGCSRLELTGRKGWKRLAEKERNKLTCENNNSGWTMKNIVMKKEI